MGCSSSSTSPSAKQALKTYRIAVSPAHDEAEPGSAGSGGDAAGDQKASVAGGAAAGGAAAGGGSGRRRRRPSSGSAVDAKGTPVSSSLSRAHLPASTPPWLLTLSGAQPRARDGSPGKASAGSCSRSVAVDLSDLDFITTLGVGNSGRVRLARIVGGHARAGKYIAVKCMKKTDIVRKEMEELVKTEIEVLSACRHPLVVPFFGAFQTRKVVYVALQYCAGGELFACLTKHGHLPNDAARFYSIELALALHHIHEAGWAYRDLKPDNLLLSHTGHLQVADFGLATPIDADGTFSDRKCGTVQYLAPEIVCGKKGEAKGIAVDWWAYGCVVYELLVGYPPFGETKGSHKVAKYEIISRIGEGLVKFPRRLLPECCTFIGGLLNVTPSKRSGWAQASSDAWVGNTNWDIDHVLRMNPPIVPNLRTVGDRSTFAYKWEEEDVEGCAEPKPPVYIHLPSAVQHGASPADRLLQRKSFKTPRSSLTPKSPPTPKTPKTPKSPKTPKTPRTPKSSSKAAATPITPKSAPKLKKPPPRMARSKSARFN